MFKKDKRYLTRGVNTTIPLEIQLIMWNKIDNLLKSGIEIDYLQIFKFSVVDNKLKMVHSQEVPEYKEELEMSLTKEYKKLDSLTVYVIDDNTHSTMLLSSEY